MDAFPLTGHCFETLLAWLPQHVHSSSVFSVRFPAAVHAASPLTSSSHAHDDELGCHRLAAGGGLGGLRATSFISSDRSLLRDTCGVAASAFSVFIPAGFFQ